MLTRAHAVTAASPGSLVVGLSAAACWGACDPDEDRLDVWVPYGIKRLAAPWLRLRRRSELDDQGLWRGIPVASPALAIVSAFDADELSAARSALFRALQTRVVSADEIATCADRIPRIRNRRALEAALRAAVMGAESFAEAIAIREVFRTQAFARLVPQHRLRVAGQAVRLDFFHPDSRTAIEIDGAAFHSAADARLRDIRRDTLLASVGILTLRLAAADVLSMPAWCRARAAEAIAARTHAAAR